MGKVFLIYKIFLEEPGIEKRVEEEIKKKVSLIGKVKETRIEPIAFGVNLIKAGILIPDKQEGLVEKIETALKGIKGITEVETEGMTLI